MYLSLGFISLAYNQSIDNRKGSPFRSKLALDTHFEDLSKEDYQRTIDQMRTKDGITEADIRQFEKTAIIQKSIEVIR